MSDSKEIECKLSDLSDIKRKAKNLRKRKYDFTGKKVVISVPHYQKDAVKPYTMIYDVDKVRYCANLRDALYLREYLYRTTRVKIIEIVTFDEDIFTAKRKLGTIDCLILTHEFVELDEDELLFELEENLGCKNIKVMKLK